MHVFLPSLVLHIGRKYQMNRKASHREHKSEKKKKAQSQKIETVLHKNSCHCLTSKFLFYKYSVLLSVHLFNRTR